MIDRHRLKRILTLALPIMGGMVSQNVLNLVDTAMVGVLGADALAAVGMASFANFLSLAFLQGFSTGVQAIASRRFGEGRTKETAIPLNGGLLLSLGFGIPLSILLIVLAPRLFPLLNENSEVIALGIPYWQARLVAVSAVAMNYCFRGYWNGVNLSRLYLRTLIVMHSCNIALNYVLIFGKLGLPALGSTGAGIGTTIATYIGTLYYCVMAWRYARRAGFLRALPGSEIFRTILRLSVPHGAQQTFFAGSLTALFWIIGKIGTVELAAANVIMNITLVAVLPGLGLGLSAASLVGQALGRGNADDAYRWGLDVMKVGNILLGFLGLPMLLLPLPILSIFIHDAATLEVARLPLQIVGATMALDPIGMVLMHSLLGAGASRMVMLIATFFQGILFIPTCWLVGPVLGFGLTGIWIAQASQRILQGITFAYLWRRGDWRSIHV